MQKLEIIEKYMDSEENRNLQEFIVEWIKLVKS